MILCDAHTQIALDAIHDRGMDALLVNDPEAKLRWEFIMEEDNGFYPETFDPLLAVEYGILSCANKRLKLYGDRFKHNSDGCPICDLDMPQWIKITADVAKKYADNYQLLETAGHVELAPRV